VPNPVPHDHAVFSVRGRLHGIEGLRALAAGSILVFHVWDSGSSRTHGSEGLSFGSLGPALGNLRAGVTLFFVLSGFLLFRPFVAPLLQGKGLPSIRSYCRNRVLRILPLYWTVFAIVVAVQQRGLLDRPKQLLADAFFLQNSIPGYEPRTGFVGFGITPAWSLCVEVVFYACLPILALWMLSLGRRRGWSTRAALAPVGAMVVAGLAAKAADHQLQLGAVWGLSFPVHADWFAMGMALAVLHACWETGRVRVTARARFAGIVVAVALSLAATKALSRGRLDFVDSQTLMAVAGALLLGFVVFAPRDALTVRVLESRVMATAGLWSYGIFLWQYPVIDELRNRGLTRAGAGGFVFNLFIVLLVTVAAAATTYRFVERPALRRKRGPRSALVAGEPSLPAAPPVVGAA
jgi:peptidoglycan/LPS O-acetylase OafA/YrhL